MQLLMSYIYMYSKFIMNNNFWTTGDVNSRVHCKQNQLKLFCLHSPKMLTAILHSAFLAYLGKQT